MFWQLVMGGLEVRFFSANADVLEPHDAYKNAVQREKRQ